MNLLYKLSCVFISSKVNVNTGTIFLISPCMQLIKEWCHLGIPISLLDNGVREFIKKTDTWKGLYVILINYN